LWPSLEDLHQRIGAAVPGAGLLSLCPMPEWILPAGPGPGPGIVFADPWGPAHDRQRGGTGSFAESSGLLRELAGVEIGAKQVERAT
jgi:hypothetical protein